VAIVVVSILCRLFKRFSLEPLFLFLAGAFSSPVNADTIDGDPRALNEPFNVVYRQLQAQIGEIS